MEDIGHHNTERKDQRMISLVSMTKTLVTIPAQTRITLGLQWRTLAAKTLKQKVKLKCFIHIYIYIKCSFVKY